MEIYKKILEVRKAVKGVAKNGTNTFHKYNYATANDVIHEIREAINQAGILIIPTDITDISFTKEGNVQHFTQHYKLIAEDGSFETAKVRCSGEDKGDKGSYKANTGAMKYLFIQVFLLPTDDDPENDVKYPAQKETKQEKPWLNKGTEQFDKVQEYLAGGGDIASVKKKYNISKEVHSLLTATA